ncbi:hypothetical protein [Nocardia sp. NPDC005366]|uniref:hypothetical protein n=1 Tax=Nocardia sp. NPDC005366 TaxID=3156878 RepID=UPI0033AF7639
MLPSECPRTTARITVELRDVTYADGAAPLIAVVETGGAAVGPGVRHPFELSAPESPVGTALSLACQVDLARDGVPAAGDLVSTQSIPVPAHGQVGGVEIPVSRMG